MENIASDFVTIANDCLLRLKRGPNPRYRGILDKASGRYEDEEAVEKFNERVESFYRCTGNFLRYTLSFIPEISQKKFWDEMEQIERMQ